MPVSEYENNYTYKSKLSDFRNESVNHFVTEMKNHFDEVSDYELDITQINAWKDCFEVTHPEIYSLSIDYYNLYLVFEYVLHYDNERADLIIIGDENIVLFEYKKQTMVNERTNSSSQLMNYYRLLSKYHNEGMKMNIHPAVVYTLDRQLYESDMYDDITFYRISPEYIKRFIEEKMRDDLKVPFSLDGWFN